MSSRFYYKISTFVLLMVCLFLLLGIGDKGKSGGIAGFVKDQNKRSDIDMLIEEYIVSDMGYKEEKLNGDHNADVVNELMLYESNLNQIIKSTDPNLGKSVKTRCQEELIAVKSVRNEYINDNMSEREVRIELDESTERIFALPVFSIRKEASM